MAKHEKESDPIADYNEWIRNRYDPGYYLGGRLGPMMRASQSLFNPREKRVGLVLVVACILLLVAASVWKLFWP